MKAVMLTACRVFAALIAAVMISSAVKVMTAHPSGLETRAP
jgi:hypothetical protein